jgi:hypothetical protein
LPLQFYNENKTAKFVLATTILKLLTVNKKLASYFMTIKALLLTKKIRQMLEELWWFRLLNRINPNYKDTSRLMAEAQTKGLIM